MNKMNECLASKAPGLCLPAGRSQTPLGALTKQERIQGPENASIARIYGLGCY